MKKTVIGVLTIMLLLGLVGCNNGSSDINNSVIASPSPTAIGSTSESSSPTSKSAADNIQKATPTPEPMYRAVAEKNAIIVEDDLHGNIRWKNKCDVCGWVDSSTTVTTLSGGGSIRGFYCNTCKAQREVKLSSSQIQ